ncbi:hypothetical protein MUG10_19120 [Xanthomonas prunicola]|uniref:hypothetical protein n=1 Tax=Xanthomonas prunicola TaxID=2053930 RepID=UPI002078AE21|nr:hypothetical protein [Xanthomonas prunicola]USJ00059.1 hypothetical protein MUG10_19120 [Xanthomonas prunicola]
MRIEKHVLIDFLSGSGVGEKCMSCGASNSKAAFIENPDNLNDQRIMEFFLPGGREGIKIGLVSIYCGSCGFVAFYAADVLVEKIRSRSGGLPSGSGI